MMTRITVLLLALAACMPTAVAQDGEEAAARALDKRWNAMVASVRAARRELGEIQLRYSGAEEPAARKAAAADFDKTKKTIVAESKSFLAEVESFLVKYPDNIPIRERRLTDSLFDGMNPGIKARDAEKLFALTANNEYLHTAAEHYGKAYEYAKCAELWQKASESAPTEEVLESLGKAYMNTNEFAKAKAAFQKALDGATGDRGRRVQQSNITFAEKYVEDWEREKKLRAENDNPIVELETTRGKIVLELFEDEAPNTVANFITLAEKKYYDRTSFFRCMAYAMCQGGDPENTGRGGPGYNIKDEYALPGARLHYVGSLSSANKNKPDTNNGQFFITNVNTFQLNGRHTVFGRVLEGLEAVQVKPLDVTNKAKPFMLLSAKVIRKSDKAYDVEKLPAN